MPRGVSLKCFVAAVSVACLGAPASAGIVDPLSLERMQPFDGAFQIPLAQSRVSSQIMAVRLRGQADLGAINRGAAALLETNPFDDMARVLLAIARAVASDTQAAQALLDAPVQGRTLPPVELAIARALIAREEGDLDAARGFADAALAADDSHSYAQHVRATVAYRESGAEAALPYLERAARLAPEGATYWANYGAALSEIGALDEAQRALSRAASLSPGSCDVLLGLGRLNLLRGQPAAAAESFGACLAVRAEDPDAARGQVVALIEAGQVPTALSALDARATLIPDAVRLRAEAHLRAGDGDAARDAIAVMPEGALRAAALGRLAILTGDLAGAQSAFAQVNTPEGRVGRIAADIALGGPVPEGFAAEGPEQALLAAFGHLAQSDPAEALAALALAGDAVPGFRADGLTAEDLAGLSVEAARAVAAPLFLRFTQTGGAVAGLALVADANPEHALVNFLAAEASARAGVPDMDRLERIARVTPRFAVAQVMRGNQFFAARDARAAFDAYSAAAEVRQDPDVLIRLGLLGETLGEDAAAEAAYRGLLAAQPQSFIAMNQLAWFLAVRADDLSEARTLATSALELQPGNAAILDTLGWIAFREGDLDLALERLGEAAEAADGGAPEIVLNLVEAQIAAGQLDAARARLSPVLRKVQNTPLARRANELNARLRP